MSQCYLGYAVETIDTPNNPSPLSGNFDRCTRALYGRDISGSANALISAIKVSPSQSVSDKAAEVYYNNQTCGADTRSGAVFCMRFGILSRTMPSGTYQNHINCEASSHTNCQEYGKEIASSLGGICDKSVAGRVYCDNFILGALGNESCTDNLRICLAYVDERKPREGCSFDTFNSSDCFNTITTAGTDEDPASSGEDSDPTDSTDTGRTEDTPYSTQTSDTGDPISPVESGSTDQDITESDINTLGNTARQLSNQFLGNNNTQQSRISAPNVSPPSALRAGQYKARPVDARPQSAQASLGSGLRISEQMPQILPPGNPGGLGAQSSTAPGGAGPGAGGAIGANSGGAGVSGIGGTGGSRGKKRRRGRRVSKKTKASELSGQRYFGATGSNSNRSNPNNTVLSKKIRDKINKNKRQQINSTGAVNAAFRQGLARGTAGSGLEMEPIFFPDVDQAFDCLRASEDLPGARGHQGHYSVSPSQCGN